MSEKSFEPEHHTPVKIRMQLDLAAKFLGLDHVDYKHPPDAMAEWFKKYSTKFGKTVHKDAKEHTGADFITRYEHAQTDEDREVILQEIQQEMYDPSELIN